MQYKNFEIHNVAELIPCEEGGVKWLRLPHNIYEKLEKDSGRMQCTGSTGVELRFVLKGDRAVIKMQSLGTMMSTSTFHVFFGGLQGGWECHESGKFIRPEVFEYEIKKPSRFDVIERISKESGFDWDPSVVRIIFNRGAYRIIDIEGDIEPPKKSQTPSKTLLTYGSSITHGSNALSASNSWASIVAHNLNMDLMNKGLAGSCCMEPALIDYIAEEGVKGNWDMATLELGINVKDWPSEKIYERVSYVLDTIAGKNPDKKIFVISPFYNDDDYLGVGNTENWRKCLSKIVPEKNYKNVTLINGCDLLGDMSLISCDLVHPNLYGVQQIADRLTDIIKKAL